MTLEADVILPGQLDNRRSGNPFKSMVLAVLDEAVRTFFHNQFRMKPGSRKLAQEALEWIVSKEESPYSFEWCCHHAGIESAKFRRDFLKMVEDGKGGSKKRRLVMGQHKKIGCKAMEVW